MTTPPGELLEGTGHGHHHHGHKDHPHGHEDQHGDAYRSWAYSGDAAISPGALEKLIRRDDLGIYRLKGFVSLTSGEIVEVQRAGSFCSITPASDARLATRLVAIGLADRFQAESLEREWRAMELDAEK